MGTEDKGAGMWPRLRKAMVRWRRRHRRTILIEHPNDSISRETMPEKGKVRDKGKTGQPNAGQCG